MKRRLSRWLLALLALVMSLGLAACGGSAGDVSPAEETQPAYTETEKAAETPEPSSEEAEEAAAEEAQEPAAGEASEAAEDRSAVTLDENGTYSGKDDVALYIHLYGHLPDNYITKKEAQDLGWSGGSLEPYAPGCSIGGSRFGNYEGLLPDKKGRSWTECDIDTMGAKSRGAKRIVFSNDGLIYYTGDHYESFELLYGEE